MILAIFTCRERQEVTKSVNETASEAREEGNSRVPDAQSDPSSFIHYFFALLAGKCILRMSLLFIFRFLFCPYILIFHLKSIRFSHIT